MYNIHIFHIYDIYLSCIYMKVSMKSFGITPNSIEYLV